MVDVEWPEIEAAVGRGCIDRKPNDLGRRLSFDVRVQRADETGPTPGKLAARDLAKIVQDAALEMIVGGAGRCCADTSEHSILIIGPVFRKLVLRHSVRLANPNHEQRPRSGNLC